MITNFSKVDESILAKLAGLMVADENGIMEEVPTIYIDPEEEFQVSEYPSIVVFRQGIYPDDSRWSNDYFFDNPTYDADGILITVDEREAPDPFNVYYGIRLYYQYQMDGVELNQHVMSRLRRGSYLDIDGDEYDLYYVSYKNPESAYRTYGEQPDNEQRTFYEQYLYRIEVELDNATRETVNISQAVETQLNLINP